LQKRHSWKFEVLDHIAWFNPARLPHLAEAVQMAQRRLGLIDAGAQPMM
tara:strand:- start:119 stop:265 length:147 start_codon:yes stop_codon:yes gene_type:complete